MGDVGGVASSSSSSLSGGAAAAYASVFHNYPLLSALIAFALAQSIKFFTTWYKERRWDPKQLIGSGGMPSSHSATVTALALAIGLQDGFGGPIFATSMILACVVMHDALGVRLHAGRQAEHASSNIFLFGVTKTISAHHLFWSGDKMLLYVSKPVYQPCAKFLCPGDNLEFVILSTYKTQHICEAMDIAECWIPCKAFELVFGFLDYQGRFRVNLRFNNMVLNQIVFELPLEHPLANTRPLRELLGHTPLQVIAGAVLGFVTAAIAHLINKAAS